MQFAPIDSARLGPCLCVVAPELRRGPGGEPRVARDGRPQWVVGVSVQQADRRTVDVLDVVVTGAEPEGLSAGTAVLVVDLDRVEWSMDGRAGVTWRAASVVPADRAAPAGSAGSGGGRGKAAAGGERS